MPRLCCHLMLPSPALGGGAAPALTHSPPTDDGGHLLPLEKIRTAACDSSSLWSGQEQLHQTKLQTAYSLWLPSTGRLDAYELMVSYRHTAMQDSECAAKLSDGLGSGSQDLFLFGAKRRRMRVFLDCIRLSLGQLFVDDIMQAMLRSRVVCPIISAEAVRRMEQIEELAREQSSTVYIICSTSEKDLQGNPVMEQIERMCASNPQLFMGYDWAGSSTAKDADLPEARKARGLEPINWSDSESVKTSDWWTGYKDGIKGKVMVCAQIRGTKRVVLIAIEGGPISQLEARELPALKQQAQFDCEKKGIDVELSYVDMSFDAFLQEHSKAKMDPSKAQRTAAIDWLLVEWILAIELHAAGRLPTILPVLFGDTDSYGRMLDLFQTRDDEGRTAIDRLPAVVPVQEVAVVEKFLLDHTVHPTSDLATRTVRQTVEALTQQFLAVRMWDLCNQQQDTVDVHGAGRSAASAAAEMHEACTVEAAKAVQETLKTRGEGELEPELEIEIEMVPEPESDAATASLPEGVPPTAPAPAPAPIVTEEWSTVVEWLEATRLTICKDALAEAGYDDELVNVVEADDEEVGDMIAAVEGIEGIKKPKIKQFKRALAKMRGKGETFT
eukprot:COSAG02_NODE_526_length_20707_cov_11.431337_20_plen_613_part_00